MYVRNHRSLPEYHTAIVRFPDGQHVTYQVPIIHAQKYTVNAMFEKKLLDDYRKINERLTDTCEKEKKSELYKDMICLIKEITDHVIPKENEARKGMDDIMGGKILTLPSDLIREGREEGLIAGREIERLDSIRNMIKYGIPKEKILELYSEEEYSLATRENVNH